MWGGYWYMYVVWGMDIPNSPYNEVIIFIYQGVTMWGGYRSFPIRWVPGVHVCQLCGLYRPMLQIIPEPTRTPQPRLVKQM